MELRMDFNQRRKRSFVAEHQRTILLAVVLAGASFLVTSLILILAPNWAETQLSRVAGFFEPRPLSSSFAPVNCDQARALGLAPAYRGQPGYAAHLDADGDGIACEPFASE
jgi:hypothetical protein